jgi:hypothetical protein
MGFNRHVSLYGSLFIIGNSGREFELHNEILVRIKGADVGSLFSVDKMPNHYYSKQGKAA